MKNINESQGRKWQIVYFKELPDRKLNSYFPIMQCHVTLLQLVIKKNPLHFVSNNRVSNQGKMLSWEQQHKHLSIKRSFFANKVVLPGSAGWRAVKQSLPSPQAVLVDPLSPLSWSLKQATFHVFTNEAKMVKIEKLSNWE